jgi:hypothetical protein
VKTSIGIWDALFGKRVTMEIPTPDGSVKKVEVTKKWLEQMESQGKMKQVSSAGQNNKPDPLLERAQILVSAAHTNAIVMFSPLQDRFPILRRVDVEHWDFILTVAGVFMAATRLNNLRLGDDREVGLMEVVNAQLEQWKPDSIRGFEDCKRIFESEFDRLTDAGHEPHYVASDAVGLWIVLNVLGRPPQTDEECMLVRATGLLVIPPFFDWWD